MRLLDLFCGCGGAAEGYHRAGFREIVGVDLVPQPDYPFAFHQGDWREVMAFLDLASFDLIHASPPCQRYTVALAGKAAVRLRYPDLVAPVRAALQRSGRPWVIENVPGSPLVSSVVLCGAMFGLGVIRHRPFELSEFILAPPHPPHNGGVRDRYVTVTGTGGGKRKGSRQYVTVVDGGCEAGGWKRYLSVAGHGGDSCTRMVSAWQHAMGIDWTKDRRALANAVPPAYTHWIAQQFQRIGVLPSREEAP